MLNHNHSRTDIQDVPFRDNKTSLTTYVTPNRVDHLLFEQIGQQILICLAYAIFHAILIEVHCQGVSTISNVPPSLLPNNTIMARIHSTRHGSLSGPSIPLNINRVWIDGCFDIMHFGESTIILRYPHFWELAHQYLGHARLLMSRKNLSCCGCWSLL